MIAKPRHRKANTEPTLLATNKSAKKKPKMIQIIQTTIEVALRPNFSAKIAASGINAAKLKVAKVTKVKNCSRG